jgi:uncharacterized membrane protein (UPF0127 family)
VFPSRLSRRAGAVLAFALAVAAPLGGCAAAEPAAGSCGKTLHPQGGLRQEPLEIVSAKGRARFVVEMAGTARQQEIGLMCRTALAPDHGMLFDFGKARDAYFWMRNTLIPLDMVFIGSDGRVFSIASARPNDDTAVPSGGPVRAVLEIPGGRAAELGLLPGDRVYHRIFRK